MAGSSVHLNDVDITRIVGRISHEAGERAAVITVARVRGNILADGLVNSGELLHSIQYEDRTIDPLKPSFRVFSDDPKAKYPEYGTSGATARPGHVLRFKPKGSTIYVFAKRVRGIRPYHFFLRAFRQLSKRDFLPK